jgi:hypothetical protein
MKTIIAEGRHIISFNTTFNQYSAGDTGLDTTDYASDYTGFITEVL